MALNPNALLAYRFPEIRQSYTELDAILYALGIGLGTDPLAANDLRFLLETHLKVLPTMAVILGTPGMWVRDEGLGIDVAKLVHAAQSAVFHTSLPPRADVVANARITTLHDRGTDKGAVLVLERKISDANSGELYCTLQQTLLLRGDGGFGGEAPARVVSPAPPNRDPDYETTFAISLRAALIYRLSGDWNPLHADPEMARKAGFERPILHGLASYGIAGWVLLNTCAAGDPAAFHSLSLRFSGVIYPGETINFLIWQDGDEIFFEGRIGMRKVLDQGHAKLSKNRPTKVC